LSYGFYLGQVWRYDTILLQFPQTFWLFVYGFEGTIASVDQSNFERISDNEEELFNPNCVTLNLMDNIRRRCRCQRGGMNYS
jgi:hypothetical protein